MIDARELRINNWVLWGELLATVASVHSNYVGSNDGYKVDHFIWLDLNVGKPSFCPQLQCDIFPIPISPDILIKAGFVNVRDVHWCVPSAKASNSFEVCLWTDHVSYTKGNNHHVEINYLHQLQNLYYSLTQQELKINF